MLSHREVESQGWPWQKGKMISLFHTLRGALQPWCLFIWFTGFDCLLFFQLKHEVHFY